MTYIDGFVVAVPTKNKDLYQRHATAAAAIFRQHGALQVVESWGDDVPKGSATDFRRAVKAQSEETVVFSWVVWPDKETREANNDKVMVDFEADNSPMKTMPFDGTRLIYGGFNTIVDV